MAAAAPSSRDPAGGASRVFRAPVFRLLALPFLAAMTVLSSCGGDGPAPSDSTAPPDRPSAEVVLAMSEIPRSPAAASPADLGALVGGNTEFALDLFTALARNGGPAEGRNIVVSPHSISTALAMTYAGARGRTAEEIAETLHFTLPEDRLHPAFNALSEAVAQRSRVHPPRFDGDEPGSVEFQAIDQLWGQRDYDLLPAFLDLLAAEYGAGLRQVDFAAAPEQARSAINRWVSDETAARIDDLLPEGSISSLTRLVLTNVIYLKAPWEAPFDPDATQDGAFHLADDSIATVPFMHQSESFGYAEGEGWRAVDIPYRGRELSMVIVVPETGDPAGFAAGLEASDLGAIVAALTPEQLELALPRFEARSDVDLVAILKALGMQAAFSPDGDADFSGMDGTRELFVSGAFHDGFVSVDEAGTEAAAATAVVMSLRGAPLTRPFAVDRPFLWFIRDVETGAILFLGQVTDPSGA